MRFIGNKENLIDRIKFILDRNKISGNSFFDFFSGTTSVAKYFKALNYTVYSSDILYFSYCLQRAYIEGNAPLYFHDVFDYYTKGVRNTLFFDPYEEIFSYLNSLPPVEGFIFQNYTPKGTENLTIPRMYFTNDNGAKIDAIRIEIEKLKERSIISQSEYFFLIAALIESVPYCSNISGVYAAFRKTWDRRALKDFKLKHICPIITRKKCFSFYGNSLDLLKDISVDILYLDPPYNERQYAPNYHILETIAKYDNPEIKGITGMRNYDLQKSDFCNTNKALSNLDYIAREADCKFLVLSYNSEGIMSSDSILSILEKYGKVSCDKIDYTRFKSNSNGLSKSRKYIQELVYILRKD